MTFRALTLIALAIAFTHPLAMAAPQSETPRRVALVIGNSNYEESPLRNPENDVRAIEQALTKVGFEVTVQIDRSKFEFEDDIDQITADLQPGDTILVFYAGHGQSHEGINYLIPVNAKVTRPFHLKERCVSMSYVMSAMEESDASLKILVFDACRDQLRSLTRSSSKGFAGVAAPEGSLIAYSTAPGQVALDGEGELSPFTQTLVEIINQQSEQGLELLDLFKQTSRNLKDKVGQRPFLTLDGSLDEFWLIPPVDGTQPISTTPRLSKDVAPQPQRDLFTDWGLRVRKKFDRTGSVIGMEVTEVSAGSLAQHGWKPHDEKNWYGLEAGDVIQAINGVVTDSNRVFETEFQNSAERMSVTLLNVQNGLSDTIFFTLK